MEIILSYSPSLNRFVDENGVVIHDTSTLFNMWEVRDWLNSDTERDLILLTKTGNTVRLIYMNEYEEDDLFDFLGYQESYKVKMDRVYF